MELFPAPKRFAIKLMMMQESVSGSSCLGNSRRVKGISTLESRRISPVRSATSIRPVHMAMIPARLITNVTALCELSRIAVPNAESFPVKAA